MAYYFMQLICAVGHFTHGKIYLFVNLLLVHGVEGDRATSPSCANRNTTIHASSPLLEALIATHHMQGGMNGSTVPMENKYLFCRIFFATREGNEAMLSSFVAKNVAIHASNALLEALIAAY